MNTEVETGSLFQQLSALWVRSGLRSGLLSSLWLAWGWGWLNLHWTWMFRVTSHLGTAQFLGLRDLYASYQWLLAEGSSWLPGPACIFQSELSSIWVITGMLDLSNSSILSSPGSHLKKHHIDKAHLTNYTHLMAFAFWDQLTWGFNHICEVDSQHS